MEKKAVPSGTYDYVTSDDGILGHHMEGQQVSHSAVNRHGGGADVIRYCSETKMKEPVNCPAVIRSYDANMGGIDKSDMLVHIYRTAMKSKRWYLCLFAYVIDVSITNAWVVCRWDSKTLGVNANSLNNSRFKKNPGVQAVHFDLSLFHAPVHAKRQTCKYCSRKGYIVRLNMVCRVCKVHLCMNSELLHYIP